MRGSPAVRCLALGDLGQTGDVGLLGETKMQESVGGGSAWVRL